MTAFERISAALKAQLFAAIPEKHKEPFAAHRFADNLMRFIIQSGFAVVMNLFSLGIYLLLYLEIGQIYLAHLVVHLVVIVLMIGCILLFSRRTKRYGARSLISSNIDILYPVLHMLCEYALFLTGPRDLGAFIRLSAVAFIIGSVPILHQMRALLLEGVFYTIYFYLAGSVVPYSSYAHLHGMILIICVVVFPCALFLSFTVYSWSVAIFVNALEAKESQANLFLVNEQSRQTAKYDQLTGLLNRRGFQEQMDYSWPEYAKKEGATATALMFDIDYFKRYNDRFGHLKGDDCLKQVTGCIQKLLDPVKVVRYGGEEFVAVAYDRPHSEMTALADHIRQEIEALKVEHPDSSVSPFVTLCVGVATHTVSALSNCEELIKMADECLYHAKTTRNRMVETAFGPFVSPETDKPRKELLKQIYNQYGEFDTGYIQRVLEDISADCTFIYNRHTNRVEFSQSAISLFGMPCSIIRPTPEKLREFIPIAGEDFPRLLELLQTTLRNKAAFFSSEVRLLPRDQSPVLVALRAQCHYGDDGSPEAVFGSILSMQKVLEYNHFLQQHSMTSSITLLPNRQKLHHDLEKLLLQPGASGYLIFADIKNFKEVNGTYSHSIGDKVLQESAFQLSKLAGPFPVYNYNVDQFVILADDAAPEKAQELMDGVRAHFRAHPLQVEGIDLPVSLSLIAVKFAAQSRTIEELMLDLDIAIQVVKYNAQGPFFTEEARRQFLGRMNLSNSLKRSFDNDFKGFSLYYQPIINVRDGRCVGVEALLRYFDDSGNLIPPTTVVSQLEKSGMMPALETWIFHTACRQCRDWRWQGFNFFIHINLSSVCIGRPSLYDDVMDAIRAYDLSPSNIVLETTETAAILEIKAVSKTLRMLRNVGVRIAIDDFGTGYSSLSYLNSLPADVIKVDRSFVVNIDKEPDRRAFLASIVSMARSMGYEVCLEGVETEGESLSVRSMGAHYYQGYYYGAPQPHDQFLEEHLRRYEQMRFLRSSTEGPA